MNQRLFISDLHLAPERPEIIQLFVRFCEQIAAHSKSLYILGDFVEYWLGDDDEAEGLQPAFDALLKLSADGCQIYFMPGNRDFLIGDRLARRCGFEILSDPYLITVGGQSVLLMHGDTLCTDDTDYMKFRSMVRDQAFVQKFIDKPIAERRQIARAMRDSSQQATAIKNPEIMDVNQDTVAAVMQQHKVKLLIHGHTHRPAIHTGESSAKRTRIVLGDWYETGNYLILGSADQPELLEF